MAFSLMGSFKIFLFLIIFSCTLFLFVTCSEFLVGGDSGWIIPKKDAQMYNDWASKNRFNVNDTLQFKYKKDSVMEVSEEDYKKCRSVRPIFFSNNGETELKLDRVGLFYFISGVSGHCERGQKLIIKVLQPPDHHSNENEDNQPKIKSGAFKLMPLIASSCYWVASSLIISAHFMLG